MSIPEMRFLGYVGQRAHDLPPSWDGVPVEWGGWTAQDITICPPLPIDQRCCTKCGTISDSTTGTTMNTGKRQYPDKPIRDLIAFRCTHCRHDHIWDKHTDQWWDLEPGDYTSDGSHDPATIGTLF